MNPVYLRLIEIALELRETEPVPNTYFQKLLSLSSGRISQICDPKSIAKIGTKGLSNLAGRGYNPKWVNDGFPNKKYLPGKPAATEAQQETATYTVNIKPKTDREKLLEELSMQASHLSDIGIAMLVGEAKGLLGSYPLPSSETAKSSQ